MSNQQANQINLRVKDKDLKGSYANALQISHTKEEFFLDFLLIHPPVGQLIKRIIISPSHAKRIKQALQDNIEKYEKSFGLIQESESASGFGFDMKH